MRSFSAALRRIGAICALVGAAGLAAAGCAAAGGAPPARPDHAAFDRLLRAYVDEDGLVRYEAWKAHDAETLRGYLEAMGRIEPSALADTAEALAFWINVYNALTIDAILHFYPVKSIKEKVSPLGYNVWKDYTITIGGEERSLDEIEHAILRTMGEPRIHFAIVCASIGCPRLRAEAYAPARLDEQLDAGARDFFADPRRLAIDPETKTVRVSPILDWFGEDFGGTTRAKLAFVARYAPRPGDRKVLLDKAARIEYLDYDWALNEAK